MAVDPSTNVSTATNYETANQQYIDSASSTANTFDGMTADEVANLMPDAVSSQRAAMYSQVMSNKIYMFNQLTNLLNNVVKTGEQSIKSPSGL